MDFPQPVWSFEKEPFLDEDPDETSYNLRAYFDRMSEEKLAGYGTAFTDEQLMAWDGNFKDDGTLLLGCSERDIEPDEYRRVIAQSIEYRNRVRAPLTQY